MDNNKLQNEKQAINVLIQAAVIAQSKGAFTLTDAELVSQAIKFLNPNTGDSEVLNQTEQSETM
jgi:hypothetical protein